MSETVLAAPTASRRPSRGASPALIFALYLAGAWSVIALLAWSVWPTHVLRTTGSVGLVAAYTTLPLLSFVLRGGFSSYPTALFRLAVVRPVLYTQLLLPIVAGAGLIGLVGGAPFGYALRGGQLVAGLALVVSIVLMVVGWLGSRRIMVREVEAQVPDLPTAFDGLRIVQVSDMHLGPHTSSRFLSRVSRTIASLSPDLVTVTGDLVDDRAEDTRYFARWLEKMHDASKPEHGVYLIPGNHDVYAGWAQVLYGLREYTRAHVLVNESRIISRNGASLALVGVGDPAARGRSELDARGAAPNLPRAFSRVPRLMPAVVFAHNPALFPAIAERGAALTLSGHTHWGQFAFPRFGWSLASPFLEHAMGAYKQGTSLLYVHPGTGFWGIPFRVGAYPEVARITLRRAGSSEITVSEAKAA